MIDPVELQVLTGALRAICEEMGAVLIRSAHSANIKERRDASTALFTPDGEMVMQAEHIPVHLGAMPAAVAAVLDEDHAPERSWILNDPYRGGTHLPDITVITPVFADARADRVRRQPRPPRRRRRPHPGLDARRQPHARRRGRGDRAPRPRRRRDRRAQRRRCASPTSAAPTCAPSSPPAGSASARLAELHDRGRRRDAARGVRRGARLRRAPHAGLPGRARRRRARGPRTCSRRARATCRSRCAPPSQGDRLTLDFTGTADQHEGNLNCPLAVTRSACYFAVRVLTDPDIPASAGAYRPIEVIAPEGSLLNARSPGGGGRRQRRDLLAGRRRRAARLRPRARPGHDEQPHARQRGRRLLRDDRRRPGRLPRRRRAERRPRGDEQHAQHAGRGARARVPAADGRVLAAPRLGRRRARTAAATAWSASSRRWRRCATR